MAEIKLHDFSPAEEIKSDMSLMLTGLSQAFFAGDKEAVQDIIGAIIETQNITQLSMRAGVSRTLIYDAVNREKNPSLETICKIVSSVKHTEVHIPAMSQKRGRIGFDQLKSEPPHKKVPKEAILARAQATRGQPSGVKMGTKKVSR